MGAHGQQNLVLREGGREGGRKGGREGGRGREKEGKVVSVRGVGKEVGERKGG